MEFERLGNVRGVYTPSRTEFEVLGSHDDPDVRDDPRSSFGSHTLNTHWDNHELIYFAGYAFWYYFNLPFCLSLPGVQTHEQVQQNLESAENLRTLEITFPDDIITHTRVQKLDFDQEYRLRRMRYSVDIISGRATSHWCYDHRKFDKIQIPTFRFANMAPSGVPNENAFIIQVLYVSTKRSSAT